MYEPFILKKEEKTYRLQNDNAFDWVMKYKPLWKLTGDKVSI